jgi:DNA-binding winged helix-turn-helix (wHTH) protein
MIRRTDPMILERDLILLSVWGNSYANSLALNVQITYLRKMLEADTSISIVSLKKRGYRLEVI